MFFLPEQTFFGVKKHAVYTVSIEGAMKHFVDECMSAYFSDRLIAEVVWSIMKTFFLNLALETFNVHIWFGKRRV